MVYRNLIAGSLAGIELLVGIAALWGGGSLIADPSGARMQMPVSFLDSTPFRSYLIPGALLFGAVGLSNVFAGYLALRQKRFASISGIGAGAILVGWMAVQIALLGYRHPIQLVFFLVGFAIVAGGAALEAVRWAEPVRFKRT